MLAAMLSLILFTQPQGSGIPARPLISNETGGIKGTVHDRGGKPVSGVRIDIKNPDGRSWIAYTDGQGRFEAGSLPPGVCLVTLSKGKHQSAVYPKVLIKANAWLLGAAREPHEQAIRNRLGLTWLGPTSYEYPAVLITPRTLPKTQNIPMH